ncbi:MAG: glycosyltransferase [Acutalibacteraceae bacterium]
MKKVMILNHGLANGGTDTFVLNTMRCLDKNKYDVRFIMAVDRDKSSQFREDELRKMNIPIYYTNDLGSIKRMISHTIKLYKILKSEKIDVFHANMDLLNGLNMFAAYLARVPVRVCHSHNSSSQYETQSGKHFAVRLYRAFMRKMIWTFSNRRLGCSQEAMDYLYSDRWKNDNNSKVIFNGVSCENFCSMNKDQIQNKKKELGINEDNHLIIIVGRMAIQKNPHMSVEVVEKLSKIRKDINVIWVGSGELENEIKASVSEKGLDSIFKFLGARKDVNELLQCSEIFLMPSLFEGQPIALIEAQAANLNCFVSDTVTRSMDCGLCTFLNNKDSDLWAKTILDCMDGIVKKELDKDKLNKFDIVNTTKDLEKIYDSVD